MGHADRMSDEHVDLVVIGLGPGGEALATGAARAGLDVVAVDKHLVGGECPYYGCIPSKMMIRAGDLLAEARRVEGAAGTVTVTPDWTPVATRIAEEATDHWNDQVAVDRLADAGATVLHGVGRLDGPRRVVVTLPDGSTTHVRRSHGRRGQSRHPTGRAPDRGARRHSLLDQPGRRAGHRPAGSLAVLGGGPIGCELAQVFARFGVEVTVVQRGDRLLPADEPEAGALLADVLADEGLTVITGAETTSVDHADGGFRLTIAGGEPVVVEQLLVAAGRTPNLDDLGLETVGLDPSSRTLDVDERLRATDGLWALGDVTGRGAFTHVAMYQSAIALNDILGREGAPASYHALPHVTFTDPEVAGVGLTEAEARKTAARVRVGTTPLEQSSRGFTHGTGVRGLIKVVEDAERGVLVGASVVGPAGGEILGFLAVAVHAAVPVSTLRTMIYAYPTFHRAIESALADLARRHQREERTMKGLAHAHRSDWVDRMAVAGLIAFGVVHLVIGWLAVQLALGDRAGGASSTGAVKELAQKPLRGGARLAGRRRHGAAGALAGARGRRWPSPRGRHGASAQTGHLRRQGGGLRRHRASVPSRWRRGRPAAGAEAVEPTASPRG